MASVPSAFTLGCRS